MSVAGLPLLAQLPPPESADATRVLLLGGDDVVAAALRRIGYRVDRHALDTGPLVRAGGKPFRPPVVTWPFPDQSFAAVVLLDELAFTVQEEEALAEAARVLRPGGVLLLRVPAEGLLAWLDGYNAYRYLREVTHRGRLLPEVAGVGWRRHYRREDLYGLLRPHFRLQAMRMSGVGLSDAARLGLSIFWRWALRSERGDGMIRRVPQALVRWEGGFAPAGRGYWWVVAAERLPAR